jgi:hypothetical protein
VTILLQSLAPGMEHGQKADLRAEVARIGGDLQQCFGSGLEEQAVNDSFVLQGYGRELFRQREDDVEIFHGEEFSGAFLKPCGARDGLTFRTMAVAAGVVSDLSVAALVASLQMSAGMRRCDTA